MQLVAVTDFNFGLRDSAETIRRGDTFTATGTGVSNATEHGRALIGNGVACNPNDWAKVQEKTQAGYDWAKLEVAKLNAESEATAARKAARAS